MNFALPNPGWGKRWHQMTDTCNWAEESGQVDLNALVAIGTQGSSYGVCGRGVLVLVSK